MIHEYGEKIMVFTIKSILHRRIILWFLTDGTVVLNLLSYFWRLMSCFPVLWMIFCPQRTYSPKFVIAKVFQEMHRPSHHKSILSSCIPLFLLFVIVLHLLLQLQTHGIFSHHHWDIIIVMLSQIITVTCKIPWKVYIPW